MNVHRDARRPGGRWIGVELAVLLCACSGGTGGAVGSGGSGGSSGDTCPGVDPIPVGQTPCRTNADCAPSSACMAANIYGTCGGACAPPPPRTCATDQDCGVSMVCVEVVSAEPCVCSPELGTECQPACTTDSCATDERCRTDGHCEPTPCDAGFACPDGQVCDSSRSGVDAHGCGVANCDGDGYACPDGFTCNAVAGADLHGCAPVPCEQGFDCPLNTDCDAASTSPHHCARRSCSTDAQCDCGGCVLGTCQDRLYVCVLPPPP
jgi:hypothetical protein